MRDATRDTRRGLLLFQRSSRSPLSKYEVWGEASVTGVQSQIAYPKVRSDISCFSSTFQSDAMNE